MGLVERVTDSGLILREEGGAAVARALSEYDRDLSLVVDTQGLWRVYARDALVCAWADRDGNPLPLSMGLLDKIKQLDRNTVPGPGPGRAERTAAGRRHRRRRLATWKRSRRSTCRSSNGVASPYPCRKASDD
jgi:hypothetical protein